MTVDGHQDRRVSGFMENGFAVAMVAMVAFMLANFLSVGGDSFSTTAVAITFVQTAYRIALFLIMLQAALELFGRERLLLRQDWQRFGGFIIGLAMLACASALMTCLIPFVFA